MLALALSPVLVIGGVRWSGDIQKEAERRRNLITLVAEEAASRATAVLSISPAMLAAVDALTPDEGCSPVLARLTDGVQFSNMAVVGPDGVVRCSAAPEGVGASVGGEAWFHDVEAQQAPLVKSVTFAGRIIPTTVIAVAARRETGDGRFDGAVVAEIPISALVHTLNRSGLPQESEIAVADRQGRVFGSRTFTEVGRDIIQQVSGGEGAFVDMKTLDGQSRVAAIVPVSTGELYVLLSSPRPAPIAIEHVNAFANFALPLLAWLLALVTAWLATDRLVLRWLDYLRRIAGLYASGKWSVQLLRARRDAPAEINELADVMEEMAANVRDRTANLELALNSRDAALKEIHHRVKNNLQIINSLLSLQSRKVSDPNAVAALDDARSRISALSLIHRSLYENTDISKVEVASFLGELVAHLDQALGAADQNITLESRIDSGMVDTDHAVPVALFTTEAVTNAVKHGFPKMRGGRVVVSYLVGPNETVLCVEDNGAARDADGRSVPAGLGTTLMSAFAKQLHGTLEEGVSEKGGRIVRIRMKTAA